MGSQLGGDSEDGREQGPEKIGAGQDYRLGVWNSATLVKHVRTPTVPL